MDLEPSPDQQAIIDLATRIVSDHATPDRLRTNERDGIHHDGELWRALVAADLIGLALPETVGGGGYGLLEAVLLAQVVGTHVAPIPFVETVAAGRLLAAADDPLAREIVAGAIVVPALREGPDASETTSPATTGTDDGPRWLLAGEKRLVSGATDAAAFLVSASVGTGSGATGSGDGVGLFVVTAGDVDDTVDSTTMTGQCMRTLRLDATPARRIDVTDGQGALATLRHELRVLRCAHLAGIAAGAVRLAAQHCKEREQFGAPIGTFQAVAHRMADAWLDANLMQATARQAAWRSDNELPATQAAASAALWACEGVQRVVQAAQHVHGGVGVDLDYPIHRYFRWAKDIELQLGGASASVRDLGAAIAAEPLTIG